MAKAACSPRPCAGALIRWCCWTKWRRPIPDVLELFFQVFDKGKMEDGEGREIDFKNTIIILTSNAGTDTLMKLMADPETMPSTEGLVKALKPELNKIFKPAFLGRLVIIPYFPIRDEALKQIVRLKLAKIQRRLLRDAQDRADPRRRADRRSGQALHRSGKRRAQRGQYSDQHAAARNLAPDSGAHGGAPEVRTDPRHHRRRWIVRLQLTNPVPSRRLLMCDHTDRPMRLTTPLGKDVLLLTAVRGREAISELFQLELETLWQDQKKPLPFDQLLGQKVSIEIVHRSGTRYFNGIVVKITQGGLDQKFNTYRLEVVPQLWLLTRQKQSRIFQQMTIPDILKEVLHGLDVTYEIQGDSRRANTASSTAKAISISSAA